MASIRSCPRFETCCTAILLLTALAVTRGEAQRCGPEALRLEEQAVQPLPPHYGIDGAVPLGDGGYALWTAEGGVLAVYPDGLRGRRELPVELRPVGLTPEGAGYRFLDRATGVEYRLGPDSAPVRLGTVILGRGVELDAARRAAGAWIVAVRDLATRRFELRRIAGPVSVPLFTSPAADSIHHIPRYHLDRSRRGLLLTRLTAPFEVLRLDPVSGALDTLVRPLAEAPLRAALPDSLGRWRALPIIEIDCGWLLTLSDLGTDQRVLVRLDAGGRLAKVTPLEVPFGVMAGEAEAATLLAARRAGGLELVWYRWRWVRDPS